MDDRKLHPCPAYRNRPAGEKALQGITTLDDNGEIAPTFAPALAFRASRHFGFINIGDPDPLAIAKADAIAVVDIGNDRQRHSRSTLDPLNLPIAISFLVEQQSALQDKR